MHPVFLRCCDTVRGSGKVVNDVVRTPTTSEGTHMKFAYMFVHDCLNMFQGISPNSPERSPIAASVVAGHVPGCRNTLSQEIRPKITLRLWILNLCPRTM